MTANMASDSTDDNANLYRNVQELKYRLEITTTSLTSLDALDGDERGSGHGNADQGPALTMADLSSEERTTQQVGPLTGGTPMRKLASQSSSDTSNNLNDPCAAFDSAARSSLKTTMMSSLSLSACYDAEGLRIKLQEIRDRNSRLVCHNNRLHSEVEAVCAKLQEVNGQLSVSRKTVDEYMCTLPHLEDQLINVRAENESLEKALRNTEERLESSQRQHGEMDSSLRGHKRNAKCLEMQLADTLKDKKKSDKDLETAVRSAEELRCSYEELRSKTKEKLKSYKGGHDELVEKLEEAKQEKRHFLDNIAMLQTKMSRLKQQHSDRKLDSYCQAELEKENTRLHGDVVRHKKKIVELQSSLTDTELMRNENCQLRNIVEDQRQQLDSCHTQLSCSKKLLRERGVAMATAQSPHDSGFGYSGQMTASDRPNLDGSYLDTLTAAGHKREPQDAAMFGELKIRLAQQECELERLCKQLACEQTVPCVPTDPCVPCLPCRCQCGDGNNIIECWRRELLSAVAKNREGERKTVELEEMVRRFESERAKHASEILSQGKRLEEFAASNSSLENKLSQRKALVSKMEQEVDEKENSIAVNERELRKRTLQITAVERQLDQKANEVSQQVALVGEMEEAVRRKVVEAQKVRAELAEQVNESKGLNEQLDSVRQTNKEQQRNLETHLEKMAQQLETKNNRVADYEHKVEQLSQDLTTKEAYLVQTKQLLHQHVEESQATVRSLETKVDDATKTVKQLEGSMAVCKEEIGLYMDQMGDMKERHEAEINEKVDALTNIQLDRAQLEQTVMERDGHLADMEMTLEERQQMLVESNRRIEDVEEEQARTQRQVEDLQHVMVDNEKLYKEDLQQAEDRVHAVSHDLDQTSKAMQLATITNRELTLEKKKLTIEVEDISEELRVEHREKTEHMDQRRHLETELTTTKDTLEEKKEQVLDMRRDIAEKKDLLDERMMQIENVTQQLQSAEEQIVTMGVTANDAEDELTAREEEITQKGCVIDEMKQEMREKMEDLKSKAKEIDELTVSLGNRQTELQQRAAQVLQLEMDFVYYKTDTEQRMAEMESTICKSRCENEQKAVQITELEVCRHNLEVDLEGCRAQIIHLDHTGCELRSNLECQAVRITRLEQLLDEEKRRAIEALKASGCCDAELNDLKGHHQKMLFVLSESQEELGRCQKENDRLAVELEQAAMVAQAKQAECCHLRECMDVLESQEAQRDSQSGADIRQLRQQMAATEECYKAEVAHLAASLAQKDQLVIDLQATLKQLTEEHEATKCRLKELEVKYDGLKQDSHDALVGKGADIARLEARIAGYERATFGYAHTPVSITTQVSQHSRGTPHSHDHPASPCDTTDGPLTVLLPVQHLHSSSGHLNSLSPGQVHSSSPAQNIHSSSPKTGQHIHPPSPGHLHSPVQHIHPQSPGQHSRSSSLGQRNHPPSPGHIHPSSPGHILHPPSPGQHVHSPSSAHHSHPSSITHIHSPSPAHIHPPSPSQHSHTHHTHTIGYSHSDLDLHNAAPSNNQHALRRSTSDLNHLLLPSTHSIPASDNGTSITNFSRLITESELSFNLSTPSPPPTHHHPAHVKRSLSDTRLHEEHHHRSLPLGPQAMFRLDLPSNRCNHASTSDMRDQHETMADMRDQRNYSVASLDASDPNCLENMLHEINNNNAQSVTSSGMMSPPTNRHRPLPSSPAGHMTTNLTLQLSPHTGSLPSGFSSPVSSSLDHVSPRTGLLSQFSSPVSPIAALSPSLSVVTGNSLMSDAPSPVRLLKPTSSKTSHHMTSSPNRVNPGTKKKSSSKSGSLGRGGELSKPGTQTGSRKPRQPSGGKPQGGKPPVKPPGKPQTGKPKLNHSQEGDSFTSPHVTTAMSYYASHDRQAVADTSTDTYRSHAASPSPSVASTDTNNVTASRDWSVSMPASLVSGMSLDTTGLESLVGMDSTDQEWSPERCLTQLAERRAALQQRQQQLNRHLHEIEDTILASDPPDTLH